MINRIVALVVRKTITGLVVLLILAALIVWMMYFDGLPTDMSQKEPITVTAVTPVELPVTVAEPPPSPVLTELPSISYEFMPYEVIDNIDCKFRAGRGSANDTAIVILPVKDGARFEVLNGSGVVFGDTLPFDPNHYYLGKRANGTVLAGFGALRRNSKVFRDKYTLEPVRIYADEQVIYETDKALEFDIASDGSSFFVHEPQAGGVSRLLIRNLDLGTEEHFELDFDYDASNAYETDFFLMYSTGAVEVMSPPGYADAQGRGRHDFYPVEGGKPRRITVEKSFALFATSEEGYFVDMRPTDEDVWKVTRREFLWSDKSKSTFREVWTREIPLQHYNGGLELSDNGTWLALSAWNFQVLDTSTGETVFEYPTVDKQAQFAGQSSVMAHGETVRDLGRLSAESFRDNRLEFFRQFGKYECFTKPGEEYDERRYKQCIASHIERGIYRSVVDVFEMDKIQLDSQPDFRVPVNLATRCTRGEYALSGLQVHQGRLTFLTTRK